jgi:hypothetical protein
MVSKRSLLGALSSFALAGAAAAWGQTVVTLPDSSQTTTLTADVTEQAQVTVPATVSFNVGNVSASTPSSAASVSATDIVLSSATRQLQISIQAAAASFTPPVTGATTWAASDVSWNAPTWTGSSSPASGTLSSSAYTTVATCDANVSTCATTALVFTLAAKPTITRSGNHTLVINWKFAGIGT